MPEAYQLPGAPHDCTEPVVLMAQQELLRHRGIGHESVIGIDGHAQSIIVIKGQRVRPESVRGVGLMIGVEFETHDQAAAVERAAFERGLLILECGESTLRFCPALIVDGSAVDTAVGLFEEALAAGLGR